MRPVLLLPLISGVVCGGAIMKHVDDIQQQDQQQPLRSIPDSTGQLQTFSSSAKNHARPVQFYYPTYPDYSVPEYPAQQGHRDVLAPSTSNSYSNWSPGIMTDLLPFSNTLLSYGFQAGTYISYFVLTVLLGSVITTLICTFTPICTISFLGFGITKSQVKEQVADLARTYITPENLNAGTILVAKAIDKYTAMQHEKRDKSEKRGQSNNNHNDTVSAK